MFLPEFMPDVMTCTGGYCGNWLVLTSKIGKPERVEVGSLAEPLITAPAIQKTGVSFNSGWEVPAGELEEAHQRAEWIAAKIRERSARIGAAE
jgi:hypothetical protein